MEPTYLRSPAAQALHDEATRSFMNRVYGWMFGGVAVSGVASLLAVSSPAILRALIDFRFIGFFLLLGFSFAVTAAIPRLRPTTAGVLFLAFAAVLGIWLSPIFLVYKLGSITRVFFVTAATFGALSAYGTVTKKNLDGWRTFLFMGFWGVLGASIINAIRPAPMLNFVIGCAGVLVFAGLTAYDTQKLRVFGAAAEANGQQSLAVSGALMLYMDFINLFISLLRLLGSRR